ncbi:MAG: nicotinate-nucleotide--dimethylbenzimidazole phosphoribosyltransferase [Actinomycetes bacterium]
MIERTLAAVAPADPAVVAQAQERQQDLLKPTGSLGALERLAVRLAGSTGRCPPQADHPAVAVFAADHGVCARGVTAWPQQVTAQMVAAVLSGGAAVNVLARVSGAPVCVVDVGVAHPLPPAASPGGARLVRRPVRPGTADMTRGPAMSADEARRAMDVGIEVAEALVAEGHDLLVAGDLGIGNTTPSAALVSAFTASPATAVTGLGAGPGAGGVAGKVAVVDEALRLHQPDPNDPLAVLAAVGGLEHAAIAGFLLAAAAARVPVVLDGLISCAAALAAAALAPAAVDHWVAGHRSTEPGAAVALQALRLEPLLDLGLRLGEGTGALLAVPIVQAASRVLAEMATFSDAGIAR